MSTGAFFKVADIDQIPVRLEYFRGLLEARLEQEGTASWKFVADTRSDQANRYLWGWLYRLIEKALSDAGIVIQADDGSEYPYTKDLLHEMFKEMFLCRATIKRGDRERKLCWSTTELAKTSKAYENGDERPSFAWYAQQIRQFASQYWHIEIPEPPARNLDYPEIMTEMREAA